MHDRPARAAVDDIGPLLAAVTLAEEISRDVSARQALLAPPLLRKTLERQSWQEAAHAAVFRSALSCLPGTHDCPAAVRAALDRYGAQLHRDLDRHDLCASLIGLQCVLEGLGAVALQPPLGRLATLAERIVPVRAFILHQEQGHQRLGHVWALRLTSEPAGMDRALATYLELAQAVLQAGLRGMHCLAAHREHYLQAVKADFAQTRDLLRSGFAQQEARGG